MGILVTGGAGYIGSHVVVQLAAAGHEPLVIDNFSNSKPYVLDRLATITGGQLPHRTLDLRDYDEVDRLFAEKPIDAVIHCAGFKAVAESVENPLRYYANNLDSTFVLLEAMSRHRVDKLVFSSSAAVYGVAATVPIPEDAPTSATSPYGRTKVMIEQVLRDVAAGQHPRSVALLRYFNPVGAHPSGLIGEDSLGEPDNLVPYIADVATGRRPRLQVFGADYPTRDGTCLRDYIHIEDLAAGHVAAVNEIFRVDPGVFTWNLGTGVATSVLEMLRSFERAVGHELPYAVVGRRPGDIAVSYADPTRANKELNWTATRPIDEMCVDAWRWQQHNFAP